MGAEQNGPLLRDRKNSLAYQMARMLSFVAKGNLGPESMAQRVPALPLSKDPKGGGGHAEKTSHFGGDTFALGEIKFRPFGPIFRYTKTLFLRKNQSVIPLEGVGKGLKKKYGASDCK
jgi:hypothetical protein